MELDLLPVMTAVFWSLPLLTPGSPATYVPYTMEDFCDGLPRTIQIPAIGHGTAIIVRSHEGVHYKPGLTCHFTVKTNKNYRIVVAFDALQFPGSPNNCSDALVISDALNVSSPICSSSRQDVISKANLLYLTWRTSKVTAASVNDGFEAVITVYKPGSHFCSFSEYRCDNNRCIDNKLACDGHNNCGDNSDETCNFWTFLSQPSAWLSVSSIMVLIFASVVIRLALCACSQHDQPNIPDVVEQNAAAVPTSLPNVGRTPHARNESMKLYRNDRITEMPVYGVTGIPVNLETNRGMRFSHGPPELENVDYPRSGVNPVVMSVTGTAAPYMPHTLAKCGPLIASGPNQRQPQRLGFTDLHNAISASNAQSPPRVRRPTLQHSQPSVGLYNHPDPTCVFSGFRIGGPMGSPIWGTTVEPIIAGMDGSMHASLGGHIGGPFQAIRRFPTSTIIGTSDDEPEPSDLGLLSPAQATHPLDTISPKLDMALQKMLLTARQQQRERRAAEDRQRLVSDSRWNGRLHHYNRNWREGGRNMNRGSVSRVDTPNTCQEAKCEKNEAKKRCDAVPTTVTPSEMDAASPHATFH